MEQITDIEDIKNFVFAGKAHFTIRSAKTGTRFTYKVSASDDGKCFFVSVLNGPDNYRNYRYIGIVFTNKKTRLVWTKKSSCVTGDPEFKAVAWFFKNMSSSALEFFHEGKCGKCGRKLTVPESIQTGLGPVCAGKQPKGFLATLDQLEQLRFADEEEGRRGPMEQQDLFR